MSRQHISFEATATLAADPEMKHTQGGTQMLSLRLVTNRSKKVGEEWKTVPYWWRTIIWGKSAERLQKVLEKGMSIYLRGEVSERKYTNKDGVEVTTVEYETDPRTIEITAWPKGSTPRQKQSDGGRTDDGIAPPPEDGSVADAAGGLGDDDLPF